MKNKIRNTGLVLVGLLCLAVLNCRSSMDKLTPAPVSSQVLKYAEKEPNDFWYGIPSLWDLKEIRNEIALKHRNATVRHRRGIEDEEFRYDFAMGLLNSSIQESEDFQQLVIGTEDNPVSILGILAGLGLTGVGTVLGGRYIKRPQEKKLEKQLNGKKKKN